MPLARPKASSTHREPTEPSWITRHATPRGSLAATWTPHGLLRITWPAPAQVAPPTAAAPEKNSRTSTRLTPADQFDGQLTAYFAGSHDAFQNIPVDPANWPPFFARVYHRCRQIGPGETLSYGEIARELGSPGAARAVGQAMARNRVPLVIPCHRVLASGGRLGGYSGPGGLDTKRWLLTLEGALES